MWSWKCVWRWERLSAFSRLCFCESPVCPLCTSTRQCSRRKSGRKGPVAVISSHGKGGGLWPLFEPIKYLVTLVQTKGFISDFPCFSYTKFVHYFSPGDFAEQKKSSVCPSKWTTLKNIHSVECTVEGKCIWRGGLALQTPEEFHLAVLVSPAFSLLRPELLSDSQQFSFPQI